MPAAAAQNRGCIEFFLRPNLHGVSGEFGVALMTRKPISAAPELDRDDIAFFVVMRAPRFLIYLQTGDACPMNDHVHLARSRGQSSTRTDAIVQHAIMKIKPLRKEPVRWLSSPMILGPKNPPILAVQLINPTAAAAPEEDKNRLGSAQKEGR